MKIDMRKPEPIIDAADLGKLLKLEPQRVMELMCEGAITSLFETGANEDFGTHRLTFRYRATKVRFTCDADGKVLKTSRVSTRPKA